MERRFLKLNWHDIKTRDKAIDKLILPIGTVEAHGITMTGTDVMIPESLSNDMADDLNAFVLPTMPYGITSSLLPYSGSIDISAEALKRIVLDIAHSVIKDNFKYLIIMNGHGGNNNALSDVKKTIYKETGLFVIIVHWWEFAYPITEKFFNIPGGHAGVDETAMMLHIDENAIINPDMEENLHYKVINGIESIPVPGPIIDYSEIQSSINNDRDLAHHYYNEVLKSIINALENIINKIDSHFDQ